MIQLLQFERSILNKWCYTNITLDIVKGGHFLWQGVQVLLCWHVVAVTDYSKETDGKFKMLCYFYVLFFKIHPLFYAIFSTISATLQKWCSALTFSPIRTYLSHLCGYYCVRKKKFSIFLSAVMSSRVFKLQVKSDSDQTKYAKLVTGWKGKAMLGDSEKTLTI